MTECGVCGIEFKRSNQRRKYCSDDCKAVGYKLKEQIYNKQYAAQRVDSGQSREYYEANRDRMIAHTRKWQESNKDKVKKYRSEHLAEHSSYESKRRAVKYGCELEDSDYLFILDRDKSICWLCSESIVEDLEFDHAYPLSKGGKHTVDNIYCAHAACNRKKHARLPDTLENIFPSINKETLTKITNQKESD